MNILGISAYYHDSAACLIVNGNILAACQEERLTRKKHDSDFPIKSIDYCLKEAKIKPSEIDYVVFYDKPFLKFERLLETYLAFAPKGLKSFITSFPVWIKDKLFQKQNIINTLTSLLDSEINWEKKLLFSEHHLSHAASAFFPSPFKNAAILTMDGVGEWTTTSVAIGNNNKISIQQEIHFPHSLGLLYSAITYYAGFKVNSGEYKIMGLAAYGKPVYANTIKNYLIDIKDDGSFFLDMSYFNYCTGLTMTNDKFHRLFGGGPRKQESIITQKEMDLAASIQSVLEEVIIKLAINIAKTTGEKNLCLAGGVALNCVANGKLLKKGIFKNIWIQPASGDAGGSIGAALCVYYMMLNQKRTVTKNLDAMHGTYLGPKFEAKEIETSLKKCGAKFVKCTERKMLSHTAKALSDGKAVGWMNGRMEFGPRSLGARSILADPRSPTMQKVLNLKVKYRESFRPFAPSILREDLANWFELKVNSPYMLLVANVAKKKQIKLTKKENSLFGIEKLNMIRSLVPAITHIDYSARIQTVHSETNPTYHKLIKQFKKITGCPIIINTSFNVRGEPIVCSPEDAFKCFMGTELDLLVIGNFILLKEDQSKSLIENYEAKYELD
jgi:carbamoyltransferase